MFMFDSSLAYLMHAAYEKQYKTNVYAASSMPHTTGSAYHEENWI